MASSSLDLVGRPAGSKEYNSKTSHVQTVMEYVHHDRNHQL